MKLKNILQTMQLLNLQSHNQKILLTEIRGNLIPHITISYTKPEEYDYENPTANLTTIVVNNLFDIIEITSDPIQFTATEPDLNEELDTFAISTEVSCVTAIMDIISVFQSVLANTISDHFILQEDEGVCHVENATTLNMQPEIFIAALIKHSFDGAVKIQGRNLLIKDWIIADWQSWYTSQTNMFLNSLLTVSTNEVMSDDLLA